ncbi:hypothetical protein G9C98_004709 [Cotesia typhae]|uniref:Uncharacterized protein n=1 Tax=Cotesia typhae TaxID=2053667 RepID=A0A8J5RB77_9HYME|nr:hypothetical protein G9C98_004709 [Cotesia typhae]
MHFWINKPAGRSRAIGGGCRRYHAATTAISASSLQSSVPLLKTHCGRSSSRRTGNSSMVSPNRLHGNWTNTRSCEGTLNRSAVGVLYQPRDRENSNSVHESTRHHGHQPHGIANSAELAGYRLRCGVWITFILATGFVSIAKFYFNHRPDKGLDVLIFCGLLVALMISGCFYTTLFRRNRNDHHYHVPEISIATVATEAANEANHQQPGGDNNSLPMNSLATQHPASQHQHPVDQHQQQLISSSMLFPSTPSLPSPSPPPYHIAILIPPNSQYDEAPPPSYEKVTR